MMACSIDLMPTGVALMFRCTQPRMGGADAPCELGKLLVLCRRIAFSSRLDRPGRLKSGMMLFTGQPLLQNGVPQSMQRALNLRLAFVQADDKFFVMQNALWHGLVALSMRSCSIKPVNFSR